MGREDEGEGERLGEREREMDFNLFCHFLVMRSSEKGGTPLPFGHVFASLC